MLKRNKFYIKVRERLLEFNKSVSIEMDGDNLVVVIEEIDKLQIVNMDKYIIEKNLNKNESKFDISFSFQFIDVEGISFSLDFIYFSLSGVYYNRMIDEFREGVSV